MRVVTADGTALDVDTDTVRLGGEAAVYDALGTARPCVIKVALEPAPHGSWLDRERDRLRELGQDPQTRDLVPRVLGHGSWEGRPFVVLERFAGTVLDVLPTSTSDRLALAARVAEVVARLREARPALVHCDLKPANFLVDGDRIVVTDLGIAREARPGATTTRALLTPDYAPPEQSLPRRRPSPSWDTFGLAATLFHLVTGEPAAAPGTHPWQLTERGRRLVAGQDDGRGAPWDYLAFGRMRALEARDRHRLEGVVEGPLIDAVTGALEPDPRRRRGDPASLARAVLASRPRVRRSPVRPGLRAGAVAVLAGLHAPPAPDYPMVRIGAVDVGVYEVDQALWERVTGETLRTRRKVEGSGLGTPCATFEGLSLAGPDLPMVCVSWRDAVRFANDLSEEAGLSPAYVLEAEGVRWDRDSDGYRLLTVEEWRRIAVAGEPCSENVADRAFGARFPAAAHEGCDDGHIAAAPVGSLPANGLGVHDSLGNVQEWLWDGQVAPGQWSVPRGVGEPGPADRDLRSQTLGLRLARGR